ncbi:MAG: arsenate reductase family protein [Anaerovorax sp.]
MNIQIFGTKKCFDTKKAQRYFKERKVNVQFIDIKEKPVSKGEFTSIARALGGYEAMIDENSKDKELLALVGCLVEGAREEKVFENQRILKTPIVRNGKKATVGYKPEVWKSWE